MGSGLGGDSIVRREPTRDAPRDPEPRSVDRRGGPPEEGLLYYRCALLLERAPAVAAWR
jgi:hypothetical protein